MPLSGPGIFRYGAFLEAELEREEVRICLVRYEYGDGLEIGGYTRTVWCPDGLLAKMTVNMAINRAWFKDLFVECFFLLL